MIGQYKAWQYMDFVDIENWHEVNWREVLKELHGGIYPKLA